MEKMTINQLPSRTWNRLGVNEATIDWDESATVVLPEESAEKADMLIASDAAYARKRVIVQAEKGTKKSLFQTLRTAGKLHVQTELTAEDGAEIELTQLVAPGENALVYDEVIGHCHGSGRIVLRQVTLGHGDVYAQTGDRAGRRERVVCGEYRLSGAEKSDAGHEPCRQPPGEKDEVRNQRVRRAE